MKVRQNRARAARTCPFEVPQPFGTVLQERFESRDLRR